MNIQLKFKLGEEVFIIFKEENELYIKILFAAISEIIIADDGIRYFCEKVCEEFKEEELVKKEDFERLKSKILELTVADANE